MKKRYYLIMMVVFVLFFGMTVNAEELTPKEQSIEFLNTYAEAGVTIVFPDTSEVISGETLLSLVSMVDESGAIVWNESLVDILVADICSRHLSGSGSLLYPTSIGNIITVPCKEAEWVTDIENTKIAVKSILNQRQFFVLPAVTRVDELGEGTPCVYTAPLLVEVNIGQQHLWVYENGTLILDSPVTTGKAKHDTNMGFFSVLYKQKNRTLRGPGYSAFVKYWMRFNNDAEGFHDASWRKEFGKSDYAKVGSHGCVNMPEENAATLYSLVSVGTPVIVH